MFKAILLDLDGTVYRGSEAISGAAKTIKLLKERGVRVFYLTNSSTKSREKRAEFLKGLGIPARSEEIYSSSYAAAKYVEKNRPGCTVFALCEGGIQEEIRKRDLEISNDEHAGVVIVGLDRSINYKKLAIAHRAIENGAAFIATNEDPTFPVEDGFLPGAGAFVAAIEKSTGVRPFVTGKPNPYLINLILDENDFRKDEVLVVGDRLETDILSGIKADVKTALVLSGVAKKKDIDGIKPDYVIESIRELLNPPLYPLLYHLEDRKDFSQDP